MLAHKVLIIHNDFTVCQILQACFDDLFNWDCLTANSPKLGLFQIIINQPKLIILAGGFTEANEIQLLQMIRKYLRFFAPIIIFTPKYFSAEEQDILTELGGLEVISNLASLQELITSIYNSYQIRFCRDSS